MSQKNTLLFFGTILLVTGIFSILFEWGVNGHQIICSQSTTISWEYLEEYSTVTSERYHQGCPQIQSSEIQISPESLTQPTNTNTTSHKMTSTLT